MKRKILYFLLILFAIIQFKGIDKTNPDSKNSDDFFAMHEAPKATENLIRTACYDCHSHESEYPWYSSIAPVSWWLADHISEGREHMNFSTWGQLAADKKDHKLEECMEMIGEKEMPMLPYMIAHNDAWLSQENRDELVSFFSSLR